NPTLIGTLGLTKRYENTHQGVFGIKAKNSIGTSGMLVGDIADNGPDSCVLTDVTLYTATSVSASLNTNNQPVITWQAPQDTSGIGTHPQPFQGYKVYRGTQKGNSVAVSNLITTTTFTDTTPLAAGTYYYYVRALYSPVISGNPLYEAHYSNNATVVITSDTIPTFDYSLSNGGNRYITPGSSVINPVTATLVGGITSPVTLSISSITNSSGTNVYNQTNGITASFDTNPINPTASSDVTLNAGAGTPAGIYTVNVNGIASSLTRTTPFTLTVDTTNLVLVNGSTLNGGGNANCNTGSVVLTWNITPGVDHYVIYKAIGAGATSTLASVDQPTSGTTVTYTDDNLVPGAYTYYVEGFDKKNNGKVISWSQPQTMIATNDTSKCLVCGLSASPTSISSGDSSTLTWSSFN
ncbi:MAG: hypothetical protein EBU69_05655, partial [Methylophilaceae bacterium]|nr:hypothetical protein [Methylophilaceae bacterium]